MVNLSRVNEQGEVERLDAHSRFRFRYRSAFYGECAFTGQLVDKDAQGLALQNVEIESFKVRRGSAAGLRNSAIAFFKGSCSAIGSVEEIDPVRNRKGYNLLGLDRSSHNGNSVGNGNSASPSILFDQRMPIGRRFSLTRPRGD